MQPYEVALLTLAALLTGALLPVLLQLRSTLRSAQILLDSSGGKLNVTLQEIGVATQEFSAVAKDLAASLSQVRGTFKAVTTIGSALGPAAVAAIHAFRTIRAEDAREAGSEPVGPVRESHPADHHNGASS